MCFVIRKLIYSTVDFFPHINWFIDGGHFIFGHKYLGINHPHLLKLSHLRAVLYNLSWQGHPRGIIPRIFLTCVLRHGVSDMYHVLHTEEEDILSHIES